MLTSTRRFVLIITLLLVGVALTWGQRLSSAARLSSDLLTVATVSAVETDLGTATPPEHIYFLDVEGWYRITPYETVVQSRLNFSGDSTDAIAAAIPSELGSWKQIGPDRDVGDDPAVVFYLNHPTVALERAYRDPAGHELTLTIIGNKGEDSFLLFSHTPETCYPGRLWQVTENRRESAMIGGLPMHAQYLLTEHLETGQKLMVLFWYLWDDPQRESKDGVLSVRINLFLSPDETKETALNRAWEFVRLLFPATIPWNRF
jgi:hypothetical protein